MVCYWNAKSGGAHMPEFLEWDGLGVIRASCSFQSSCLANQLKSCAPVILLRIVQVYVNVWTYAGRHWHTLGER